MQSWNEVLFSPLACRVNVGCGPAEERVLLTGLHAVADIYCENCKTTLGWKYVSINLFCSSSVYFVLSVVLSVWLKVVELHLLIFCDPSAGNL